MADDDTTLRFDAGRRFKGKMRRTPSAPGSFVIEDFDGRQIAEGVADGEGERS